MYPTPTVPNGGRSPKGGMSHGNDAGRQEAADRLSAFRATVGRSQWAVWVGALMGFLAGWTDISDEMSYEASQRAIEILRKLWSDDLSAALWGSRLRTDRVSQAEILFSSCANTRKTLTKMATLASAKAPQDGVRGCNETRSLIAHHIDQDKTNNARRTSRHCASGVTTSGDSDTETPWLARTGKMAYPRRKQKFPPWTDLKDSKRRSPAMCRVCRPRDCRHAGNYDHDERPGSPRGRRANHRCTQRHVVVCFTLAPIPASILATSSRSTRPVPSSTRLSAAGSARAFGCDVSWRSHTTRCKEMTTNDRNAL